ncbi:MAG: UDP-N-acetylglucosamine 1-carboxyvinyltransferase [Desulfosarcinaceae bacterium]|nr:UDP-N-acetylglucosamine 1-carboxyvinyltransferase [Desulfosarcinaceae bacterium]
MDKLVIEGGRPLNGEVAISGAKNAALPILFSALLTDGPCVYHNIPYLRDILSTIELLETLGARCTFEGRTVTIDAGGMCCHEAPYDLVRKMRASILVLGPLMARLKQARVSLPGGCAIGARPINLHLRGLERMGARIELSHGYVETSVDKLRGNAIYFDVVTVTGTENLMMAATLAEGTTILRNAAREPEIIALADVLRRMGARISGDGSEEITIEGVDRLTPVETTIIPDRIEAGTFVAAAALTGGDVTVTHCDTRHLGAILHKIRLTGAVLDILPDQVRVRSEGRITSVDIKTQPYPGFPTDMQAQFMALMTVGRGLSMVSETIFENRFIHVSELQRMGADITVSGDTALVKGVPHLSAAPVMASDLRASASLVMAGLVARGQTVVNRVYHLDRGYEAMEEKFKRLGAAIWREKG